MIDRYTKIVLTVIALSLSLIAVQGMVPDANATGVQSVKVVGPVDVNLETIRGGTIARHGPNANGVYGIGVGDEGLRNFADFRWRRMR